jgi:hypothetical protein
MFLGKNLSRENRENIKTLAVDFVASFDGEKAAWIWGLIRS